MGTNRNDADKIKACPPSGSCEGCGNGVPAPGAVCPVCSTPEHPPRLSPTLPPPPPEHALGVLESPGATPPTPQRQLRRQFRRSATASSSTATAISSSSSPSPGQSSVTRRQLFRDDPTQPSTSTGRRSTTCPVCSKTFASAGKLSQHSLVHTGERPHRCSACPKAFSSKFKLVRHALIHTDHRQYTCPVCDRTFHRKDHLKNHAKVHSPVKWRYKCWRPGCDKEYSSALSLKKHEAGHAAEEGDLECKMCGQIFDTKEAILFHLKVHAGSRTVKTPADKKYRCDHCERKFFTGKDVRRHSVVHTGRRDFLCQFCPQRFGRKDHLVRHMKKFHLSQTPRHKKQQQAASSQQGQSRRSAGTMKLATAVIQEAAAAMAAAGAKPGKVYPPGTPTPIFEQEIAPAGGSSNEETLEDSPPVLPSVSGAVDDIKDEPPPAATAAHDFTAEELSQFSLPELTPGDETFILETLLAPPPPHSPTLDEEEMEEEVEDEEEEVDRPPRHIPPLPTFKQAFPPPPKPPS